MDGDCLHVYRDGFLLVVACNVERHNNIARLLHKKLDLEGARTPDQFGSVFVWPQKDVPDDRSQWPSALCLMSSGFVDHRNHEVNTLEQLADLLFAAS